MPLFVFNEVAERLPPRGMTDYRKKKKKARISVLGQTTAVEEICIVFAFRENHATAGVD